MCVWQCGVQFNGLYEESIDKSEKAALPNKRMANIMDHLTWEIYLYIQRGLFERHKLVFALILATKIWVSAGKVGIRHDNRIPLDLPMDRLTPALGAGLILSN